jgi:predicted metalloprotease with PDZ domain
VTVTVTVARSGDRPREEGILIRYSVQLADPDRHHFSVECRLENPAPQQAFMLPSWIPGSYLLREFARHVVAIEAEDAHGSVALEQTAKGTWVARGAEGLLIVRAVIYAFDLSVRGAYFDRQRAFFNGTSLFLLPEGHEESPVELTLERPRFAAADWRVATALRPDTVDAAGFGRYVADDYDELIDHPAEIGDFTLVEFTAASVPHRFAIAGRIDTDPERLAADLTRICTAQIDFFGRPAPFDRYVFLGLAVGNGYGGLEHRASTSLIFKRGDLPKPGESGVPRDYQRFLALASHEYFHSWHVKRSKPAAFMPYRLDRRNHTSLLWVFEGITSYYQDIFLLRSGLIGRDAYLRRLGELLTRVYRVPGRRHQSLAAASFNAWDQLYKPDANSVNAGISYYSKGALVALALDLTLRSAGSGSLDDLVQALWQRFGREGRGLPEDGFELLAAEIGGAATRGFFDAAVRGTEDPDLEALFGRFGLRLVLRQTEGPRDGGGTPPALAAPRLSLGASFETAAGGLKLLTVQDGQPAQGAGLAPGDIIVALDRIQATGDTLEERLGRYEEGDEILVSFFRGDLLSEARLRLAAAPADTCFIAIDSGAPTEAVALRRAWLGD